VRREIAALCAAGAALACLGGCSDDDDGARQAAEGYSLDVERIADDVDRSTTRALETLNRVADDKIDSGRAIEALEADSARVTAQSGRLAKLDPPEPAAATADDLEFQLDSLARSLDSAATDVRVAERGAADLTATGRSSARVALAEQSGVAALSRALRALALESAD
jgi:ATP phosphoribosyltransferase regulatory subunit HisZ